MTVDRLKYASKDDYDSERYWGDRFRKHGLSLLGPGHDGFSLEENEAAYREAGVVFVNLCLHAGLDLEKSRVLEIGCGTGYYAEIFRSQGVADYLGVDVTDSLFGELHRRFRKYRFAKIDIAATLLPRSRQFNVITLIDVAQHIVNKSKFEFALDNIDKSLALKGSFIFTTDLEKKSSFQAFYEKQWILNDFVKCLSGYEFGVPQKFRDKFIVCSKKK
jgi:2-polyprenyl-3-methyl-5-hydroxy-6-metoxy-1,4-benzoquinol methylase